MRRLTARRPRVCFTDLLYVTAEELVVNYVHARGHFPRQSFGVFHVARHGSGEHCLAVLGLGGQQSSAGSCHRLIDEPRTMWIISYVRPTPLVGGQSSERKGVPPMRAATACWMQKEHGPPTGRPRQKGDTA